MDPAIRRKIDEINRMAKGVNKKSMMPDIDLSLDGLSRAIRNKEEADAFMANLRFSSQRAKELNKE